MVSTALGTQALAGQEMMMVFTMSSSFVMYATVALWVSGKAGGITRDIVFGSCLAVIGVSLPIIFMRDEFLELLRTPVKTFYESMNLPESTDQILASLGDAMAVFAPLGFMGVLGLNRYFARSLFKKDRSDIVLLQNYRLPVLSVWILITSLSLLAASMFVGMPIAVKALVYVFAGVLGFLYLIQGVALAQHMLHKRLPLVSRLIPVLLVLAVFFPPLLVILYGGLVLFGISETWIQYRPALTNENKETFLR